MKSKIVLASVVLAIFFVTNFPTWFWWNYNLVKSAAEKYERFVDYTFPGLPPDRDWDTFPSSPSKDLD